MSEGRLPADRENSIAGVLKNGQAFLNHAGLDKDPETLRKTRDFVKKLRPL